MKFFYITLIHCLLLVNISWGQFAPAAGQAGSTAIHKDSSILIAWATQCVVNRGPQDISQPSLGQASVGTEQGAIGQAGDGGVLSLGDGGSATLTFAHPIQNRTGADFAVFENSFSNTFLELAFVEVSSDGQNFVRFPAISNTDTSTQVGSFGNVDPTKIYNLAGKYRANYGTPFDLEELRGVSTLLNINAVTHVRLIDVVGCIQDAYASRDSRGYKVNDPWSTPFSSSGFDLDAVGVIHEGAPVSVQEIATTTMHWYPNPLSSEGVLYYSGQQAPQQVFLYNNVGQIVWQSSTPQLPITLPTLTSGVYTLVFWVEDKLFNQKIILQ